MSVDVSPSGRRARPRGWSKTRALTSDRAHKNSSDGNSVYSVLCVVSVRVRVYGDVMGSGEPARGKTLRPPSTERSAIHACGATTHRVVERKLAASGKCVSGGWSEIKTLNLANLQLLIIVYV